jgi:hypothetical protein
MIENRKHQAKGLNSDLPLLVPRTSRHILSAFTVHVSTISPQACNVKLYAHDSSIYSLIVIRSFGINWNGAQGLGGVLII